MPNVDHSQANRLPTGSYPVMLTAFHSDGSIDWSGIDRLTDFYIETGAAGLFAGGLSAEVDQMTDKEKIALAARVVDRASGRVPVIAGAMTTGLRNQQLDLVSAVRDTGATAVTISACQLADADSDDSTWIRHAESFLEQMLDSVPLALYECPWPYHRLLGDESIRWAVQTRRFCFMKDTCCDTDVLARRIELVRSTRLQLFNANNQRLLFSLRAGADGFCGVGANYFPRLFDWLCRNFHDEPELADELQTYLFSYKSLMESTHYPVTAKEYLCSQGLDISTFSRRVPHDLPVETRQALQDMRRSHREWLERLFG